MIILLSGFMGAGKTTLLNRVRKNSVADNNFLLLDLDEEIEKSCQLKIAQLIEKNGWDYFRKVEKKIFYSLCNSSKNIVIALGGGTLDAVQIAELRANHNIVIVWLNTAYQVCMARVAKDSNSRPMLKTENGILKRLYENRQKTYEKCDIVLVEDEQKKINNINDVLNLITNRLKTSNFVKYNYDLNL